MAQRLLWQGSQTEKSAICVEQIQKLAEKFGKHGTNGYKNGPHIIRRLEKRVGWKSIDEPDVREVC